MKQPNIKAIFFDFDGTVLDTEKYYMNFWIKSMNDFGYKMSKQQYLSIRSMAQPYLNKQIKQWFGQDVNCDALRVKRFKYRDNFFAKHHPQVKKGIRQAITWANKHGYITAMVTSGDPKVVYPQLDHAKLTKYFSKIIFSEDLKRGKPAPDIYLQACKVLKLKPNQCLAIEDCPNGVISAIKAKIKTIMIPDLTKPDKDIKKLNVIVVKDGIELIKYLKKLESKKIVG